MTAKKWTTTPRNGLYLESAGKHSCAMGYFGKGLEFWSYPVKLIRALAETIQLPEKKLILKADEVAHLVKIKPQDITTKYSHALFSITRRVFSPIEKPGSHVIYEIETSTPLRLIVNFLPELNLMWPGSIGGQDCFWYEKGEGFCLYEPTKSFSGLIRLPGARVYSRTGDHAFSDEPYKMVIDIPAGHTRKVLSVFGVMGDFDECFRQTLDSERDIEKLSKEAEDYYGSYIDKTVEIETPDDRLNSFFTWAKISMLKGVVSNPLLGEGLVAGIGPSGRSTRPGFDWFFAGDMSMNSLGFSSFGDFTTVRDSLVFYSKYQKDDGRIPHEISQSAPLIDWFNRFSGYAYLHADTTAYYLLALANYVLESGDKAILAELSETINRAIAFCEEMSEEESGLIVNEKAGLGALEIGKYRKPKYDIYTSGIWAGALQGLSTVFDLLGDSARATELDRLRTKVSRSLERFWWEEGKRYCLSIQPDGTLVKLLTFSPFFPAAFEQLDKKRTRTFLKTAKCSSMMAAWGLRSVEKGDEYDPVNYNFGSVWYFFNGIASMAFYKAGDRFTGHRIINGAVSGFYNEDSTHMPELFSGDYFVPLSAAVPHQIFSLGTIMWSIVSGMLGIRRNGISMKLELNPQFPAVWNRVTVKNLVLGVNLLTLHFERTGREWSVRVDGKIKEPFTILVKCQSAMAGKDKNTAFEICGETTIKYSEAAPCVSQILPDLERGVYGNLPVILSAKEKDSSLAISVMGYEGETMEVDLCGREYECPKEDGLKIMNGKLKISFHETGVKSFTLNSIALSKPQIE